jgi:alkyl hydroperoxide reductase subunit AhpC
MTVFRQYRCYDDFEKAALHGTFLIDAAGRIRWQDISHEPFMDMTFLLRESRRLLSFEPNTTPATTVPVAAPGVAAAGE